MAVVLPRVQRAAPQEPASVGRLDVQAPSVAEAASPGFEAVGRASNKMADAFVAREQQIEKQAVTAADIKSSDVANQFELWSKQRLNQIKLKEGDTTQDYVTYDTDAEAEQARLLGQYENIDPRFKQLIQNKLNNTYAKQETFRNIQQSEQTYKYRRQVVEDTVSLNQDSMYSAGNYLDVTKPGTFLGLQSYRDAIIQARIAEGDQMGTLRRGANGEPLFMEGAVGIEIKKDVGDTVVKLVKALNGAGKVNEAKKLTEDYADYMNAADRSKLMSDSDEANVKNQALNQLQNMRLANAKDPKRKDTMPTIAEITNLDLSEQVKQKMREYKDQFSRQEENERSKKRSDTYIGTSDFILRQQNSNTPFVSWSQFLDTPEGKNATEVLTPPELNNLKKQIEVPVKSTQDSLKKFNDGKINNNIHKWTPKEYLTVFNGLNEVDREELKAERDRQIKDSKKSTEELTGATGSAIKARMSKELKKRMTEYKIDGANVFDMKSDGKDFEEDYDNDIFNSYTNFLGQDLQAYGKTPTFADEAEIVNKRFQQLIQQREKDNSGVWATLMGVDYTAPKYIPVLPSSKKTITQQRKDIPASLQPNPPASSTTVPQPTVSATGAVSNLPDANDSRAWLAMYRKVNPGSRPSSAELRNFINQTISEKGR